MNTSSLVQKAWNFCHTLRDDGVGYGGYLVQLQLEMSIPQDPNDEPANVLLARIRAERVERANTTKPRSRKTKES